jgi:lipopolysaccharide/colanic/teichoic acid biosynthesis glycosyltransferase
VVARCVKPTFGGAFVVAKVNRRLQKPSSHTRFPSRLAFADVLWGGISPLAAFLLRDGTIWSPGGVAIYCSVAFFASLLVFYWFQTSSPIARYYSIRDGFELFKACVLIAALTAIACFLLTRLDEAPRSIPVLHLLLLASGLLGGRLLLRLREARRDSRIPGALKSAEHVLLIGASRLAWFFTEVVEELAPGCYQIVAILDEAPKLKHRSLNGYPIIGAPADLEKVIADYAMHGVRIDKVVIAARPNEFSPEAWSEVTRICRALRVGIDVLPERLMPDIARGDADKIVVAHPSSVSKAAEEKPAEENLQLPLARPFWVLKRGIDICVALVAAIALSPVIVALFGLVLLDVGFPVVFWQQRVGRFGTPLHLHKFRTLQTLFDRETKERREAQQPSAVGRLLRRTHFDELPQLWNVLTGDMSLIGPRPLLLADQPNDFTGRLTVRPGVTGWAQICGGKTITAEEKNALDQWYIRHACLQLDMTIMLRTIWMLLVTGDRRDENAIAVAFLDRPPGELAAPQETPAQKIAS